MRRWIFQPGHLLTALLALACLVLLAVLGLQRLLVGGGELPAVSVAPNGSAGGADLTTRDFELPPLEQYADIKARPLFNEDRRPAPEEGEVAEGEGTAEQVAASELPPVTLTGVIITPDERVAMLEHNRRNEQISLKQGEILEGWTLETVEDRRVVFASGDSEQALLLEVYTGPAGGGRGPDRREQAAASADQNKNQPQSAADLIRERIARERERRRQLMEQARQGEAGDKADDQSGNDQ